MGASAVPILLFTTFWGVVGIVLPFVIPKGPNRGILQVVLILTAATCWLFWLCCYMAQMNPLIGPKLSRNTILLMARHWHKTVGMLDEASIFSECLIAAHVLTEAKKI